MKCSIDEVTQELNRILGNKYYFVGGMVRDILLGRPINDIDCCTPHNPDEVEELIKAAEKKCYNVGKRFGTLGVTVNGEKIEITTFRSEKYKPNCRKPDVEFVDDITADLSRRDFTINAIAVRPGKGYIDPTGGRLDLIKKTIRCVGKPKDRFKEDPLRLLRAARFASQLGFEINQGTFEYMCKMSPHILTVSKERWMLELEKILLTDKPSVGLDILAQTRLLNFMFPELSLQVGYDQDSQYHSLDLWNHTLTVVDLLPNDANLRLAGLLHDIGKPFTRTKHKKKDYSNYIDHQNLGAEIVLKYAKYLNWSKNRTDGVYELVLNHMKDASPLKRADDQAK